MARTATAVRHGLQGRDIQEQSLEHINRELLKRDLCPLAHLGVERDGWRILAFVTSYDNDWYSIVQFLALRPDNTLGEYFEKFSRRGNTNRTVMTVPLVWFPGDPEPLLVFVRQHRATMLVHPDPRRAWTTEFAREFPSSADLSTIAKRRVENQVGEKTLVEILSRELAPLMLSDKANIRSWECIDCEEPEDTGSSTVLVDTWLINFDATSPKDDILAIRGTRDMGLRYYLLSEVEQNRRTLGIRDFHTKSGLLSLYEYLNRNAAK